MIPSTFATKRLIGSRLSIADLETLCAMHRDPAVMATLGGIRSPARTRAFLRRNLRHWEQYGFGLWTFRGKADGRFVGRGGLRHVILHGRPEVEINYALMPSFWGQGFATEIGTATVDVGVGLGFPWLVAFALPDNHSSRRVMEKLGFHYERDIVYLGIPHVLYRRQGGRGGRPRAGATRDGGRGARSRAAATRDGGRGGRPEPPNFK